jgi:branched-chain amino acid transport system ATP-binding protein
MESATMPTGGQAPLLDVQGLAAGYGPIEALRGVNLKVYPGEIVALIGSNGAGKSTLLMTLCGIVRPRGGRVLYRGRDVTGLPPHVLMRQGMAQVPEGRRIFPGMTVLENLQMGAAAGSGRLFREKTVAADLERVYGLFPVLHERAAQRGGTLSGGEQQMLAIARGLMSRPKLLLLDEPSLGLAPLIVKQIFRIIEEINRAATAILLVEQNAYLALKHAQRASVLAGGEIVLEGTAQSLLDNPEVRRAYLGG